MSEPDAATSDTLHPADSGCNAGIKQSVVGGFKRKPTHSCQSLVDRGGGELLFKEHRFVLLDQRLAESSRDLILGPGQELVHSRGIGTAGGGAGDSFEGQPPQPRLCFFFWYGNDVCHKFTGFIL